MYVPETKTNAYTLTKMDREQEALGNLISLAPLSEQEKESGHLLVLLQQACLSEDVLLNVKRACLEEGKLVAYCDNGSESFDRIEMSRTNGSVRFAVYTKVLDPSGEYDETASRSRADEVRNRLQIALETLVRN